jgi:hypothetical protein
MASAMTEHRRSGQIGHPAAWMMESTCHSGKVGDTLAAALSFIKAKLK